MASARVLVVRASLMLNAVLVLYLCVTWLGTTPTTRLHHPSARLSPSSSPMPYYMLGEKDQVVPAPLLSPGAALSMGEPSLPDALLAKSSPLDFPPADLPDVSMGGRRTLGQQVGQQEAMVGQQEVMVGQQEGMVGQQEVVDVVVEVAAPGDMVEQEEPPREVQERGGVTEQLAVEPIVTEPPDPPLDSQERKIYPDLRECSTRSLRPFYQQRGDYWVLENYVPAALSFRCDESITYTTHGDYTFLDNLEPLTSRWQGPVSVAVYAPGTDFNDTVNTILYLRDCWAEGIKKYVTFHLFFHVNHTPKKVPTTEELIRRKTDCGQEPPRWTNITTYRQRKKLLYPVNVARNTARQAVQTYFVFASDVELYPSINFIPEFFKMLKKTDKSNTTNPRVYVFSIFEVRENVTAPETKQELQTMLTKGDAIPFHKNVCAKCHNVPMSKEWMSSPVQPGMSVFHIGKRKTPHHKWEPIYIGTNKEPLYDERLSWEGKSDKMTQMYILCVRDYEFHILDNAFLVHRPGIKKIHKNVARDRIVAKQNTAIKTKILPEYKTMFGYLKSCVI